MPNKLDPMKQEDTESYLALANNMPSKDRILCEHCKRTNSNGLSCIGKCVSDNDY